MNSVLFGAVVVALASLSFQPTVLRGRAVLLALHPQIESRHATTITTSDPEEELTAETGVWKLKNSEEMNSIEEKVRTYTFKPDHKVIEEKTTGTSIIEEWSVQTMGDETQLKIGSALYRLYFKKEGGTTEMRLAKLANSKAEPSTFLDYKRSPRRE